MALEVALKSARERRDEARRLQASGTDPAADRKAGQLQAKPEAERAFNLATAVGRFLPHATH